MIWSLLPIVAALCTLGLLEYRAGPDRRAQRQRFLHNRTALLVGGALAVVVGVQGLLSGHPGGLVSAVLVGALVAAGYDRVMGGPYQRVS